MAGSYHAPERKYEPGGVESPPGTQATLLPSRDSAIDPLRPLPSVNAYVSVPCVQSLNASVAAAVTLAEVARRRLYDQ